MASQEDDFAALMRRAAGGDEDAARQLVAEYEPEILRAVRRVLRKKRLPRTEFDSADFTQSVWRAVFHARDGFDRFKCREDLVAFLVTAAHNKVESAARRCARWGQRGEIQERQQSKDLTKELGIVADRRPDGLDVAIAREKLDRIRSHLPRLSRKIVDLRLEGYTHDEIAARLRVTRGVVHRVLKRLSQEHP